MRFSQCFGLQSLRENVKPCVTNDDLQAEGCLKPRDCQSTCLRAALILIGQTRRTRKVTALHQSYSDEQSKA